MNSPFAQPDTATGAPSAKPGSKSSAKPAAERLSGTLSPIAPKKFGYEQARHLLWRAGFGGSHSQIKMLADWGPVKSVDYLLSPEKVAFDEPTEDRFSKDIIRPPTREEREAIQKARREQDEDALAELQRERQRREQQDRAQVQEMQKWWLRRMIETPRPLEEKMTLLWHGHFATNYRAIENSYHMYRQNLTLRTLGLGNFGEMLRAIIRDPAMLAYLNNNQSRRNRPNENLSRELMELFSLGVGNYTERDIKEGARALTGYTFEDDTFRFDQRNHDNGGKDILGASDNFDGDGFVDRILAQPACASFIARKLYNFFLSDIPPDERGGESSLPQPQRAVLRELAQTIRGGNYEIRPALRRLFLSEHFYEPRFMNEQIKSPAVLVVGAIRSLNTPVRDLAILKDALDLMGQNLLLPPSVKGWEGGRSWINTSTLFVRQNIMAFLLTGKKPLGYDPSAETEKYDPMPLLSEMSETERNDAEKVADHLLNLCVGRVPGSAKDALLQFFGSNKRAVTRETIIGSLLLITAMPEYQLC